LKKTPPSLTGSEISDFGEIRESFEGINLDKTIPGKIKKEISWSDEVGHGDIRQEFNHKVRSAACCERIKGNSWLIVIFVRCIGEVATRRPWQAPKVKSSIRTFSWRSSSLRLFLGSCTSLIRFMVLSHGRISVKDLHGRSSSRWNNPQHASVLRLPVAIIGLVRHSDNDYRD
jgi:hypothetical protein